MTKATNGIRFLRKKYVDPTTGKDEWKPIHMGQNKAPTAMGFFGQPLAGSTLAGIGPGGANGVAGASTLGSSFGASSGSSSAFGSSSSSMFGASGSSGATGGQATSTDAGASSGTGSTAGLSEQTGQTFGGAGIIGFSPNSPKQSILVYKKKNHYNEWEFVYDPIADQMMVGGSSGPGGQSAASISNGIGPNSGSSGTFGGNNPGGNAPTATPPSTTPTQ